MCLTPNERRALTILRNNPRIPARIFAILYYGDTPKQGLLSSKTPLRRGSYYGKRAWTSAASFLTHLSKKGYVVKVDAAKPVRYYISSDGQKELDAEDAA